MPSNIDLFRAIIERGFNRGDGTVADEICADRFIEHEFLSPSDRPGPEILKAQIRDARSEVEDLQLVIEDVVEAGDKIWGRMTATGRARNGKNISIYVLDVCRFEDGKLVEHWGAPRPVRSSSSSGISLSTPNELMLTIINLDRETRPDGAFAYGVRVVQGDVEMKFPSEGEWSAQRFANELYDRLEQDTTAVPDLVVNYDAVFQYEGLQGKVEALARGRLLARYSHLCELATKRAWPELIHRLRVRENRELERTSEKVKA
jgi:predicted SnoaL-like aldol condensation-catalyzing enzyme